MGDFRDTLCLLKKKTGGSNLYLDKKKEIRIAPPSPKNEILDVGIIYLH